MTITEEKMKELKGLVDAVFVDCNRKETEHKLDVTKCMCNFFSKLKPNT